jgi:hypothetical protein
MDYFPKIFPILLGESHLVIELRKFLKISTIGKNLKESQYQRRKNRY